MGLLAIVLVLVALVFLPLDAGTTGLIKNIGVGRGPSSVAVDPTTNKIYVANAGSNTLPGINGQTHAVSAVTVGSAPDGVGVDAATTLSVQTNPGGVVVDAARNKIYVTNRSANQHSDRYRDQYARSYQHQYANPEPDTSALLYVIGTREGLTTITAESSTGKALE